mgnify:CR=1 FL=1
MVMTKNHSISRSSSCLRKYRILFVFGITVLCVQIYLAHIFFGLEIRSRRFSQLSSGEVSFNLWLFSICNVDITHYSYYDY